MSVVSDAQLCSIALLRVGERQLIDDLNASTAAARACKAIYAQDRDQVLEALPWPFAEREATLALSATETKVEWEYVYVLPTDCVRPEYLWAGIRNPPPETRVPFKRCVGLDADDNPSVPCLATDMESAILIYTSKVTNPTLFPSLFVEALAWKLAADLALAHAVKPQLVPGFLAQYQQTLMKAFAEQLNQAQGDQPVDSEIIRTRDGASTLFPIQS